MVPASCGLATVVGSVPAPCSPSGIAFDARGRLYIVEFFRNLPDEESQLRNEGPLEFPTSPFLVGRKLCITHSDGNRRDNAPNSGGEVGPGREGVAKISCLDQPLPVSGLPLPVK